MNILNIIVTNIYKLFIILIPMFYMSISHASDNNISTNKHNFLIYDSIGHKDKIDLSKYGLVPLRAIPTKQLWPKDTQNYSEPDLNWISKFAQTLPNNNSIICLDIEHWDLHGISAQDIDLHIKYLASIIKKIREIRPNLMIGYYGIIPIRNYHAPVKSNEEMLKIWKYDNRYLQKLADHVDVIFPSLYTFYRAERKWIVYAKANIQEAKKYGKPVIPFIWPQYHGSNKIFKYSYIDEHFWKIQLKTTYKYADGVAIWSPWGSSRSEWDSNAGWWKATLEFINTNLATPSEPVSKFDS